MLGGGFGLRVKRAHLANRRTPTLAQSVGYEVPEARATSDLDLFLRLEIFSHVESGLALRSAIDELGYVERTPKWQFQKPLSEAMRDHEVVLDLLAREPDPGSDVRVKGMRVGSGAGVELHGHKTPEAFAVEEDSIPCDVLEGDRVLGTVNVVHPFAMLNMKVRASHDWLRFQNDAWELRERQSPPSAKHVFDCALIVAMVTQAELEECRELCAAYREHPIATEIRQEALMLFELPTSPGWLEARRQGMFDDHELIWGTMMDMLGQ